MQNRQFILLTFIVLISCGVLVWVFNNYLEYENQEKNEKIIDLYLDELTGLVNKNRNLVLTASVLLAKDEAIKRCLKTNKRCNCFKYLTKSKQGLLDTLVFDDLKIHIHDRNLKSFYRLWSNSQDNDSLSSFRYSLNQVKNTQKSLSCIEIGRYSMLIRGITPVIEDGEYLGSIEAITNFDSVIKHFDKKGVKLFILMNKEYEYIVSKIKFKEEQKLKNYTLLNETNEDISFLKNMEFKNTSYQKVGYFYLINTPIYDLNHTIIGYYVLKVVL
ncbi:hypothetical protein CRV08_08150 [Halarcobacter ebronensis]|uniref:Double Cache domain-containing protein n=1 Tax=Halarcobacter ebronensis TaxID=1462615 RepID=A0A4Q0YCT0_9BACT|nr:cache domain-containing protein [Halarcobacter ebronensis]RXJ68216.1 hypothetical protein CRV08_08150 [Halarcobacter ebronensis]